MQPHASERRHLERQITYARPIFLLLALVDLLELKPLLSERNAVIYVAAYLGLALALAVAQISRRGGSLILPIYVDLVLLAGFLLITPSVVAFWFLFLFVTFSAGINWGLRRSILLAAGVTLALLARTIYRGPVNWPEMISWVALTIGTFGGGAGISFLGDRNRRHAAEHEFQAHITGILQVERGLAESLRLLLQELARAFVSHSAILVFRDADLERIFVWKVNRENSNRIVPESIPLTRGDGYWLGCIDASIYWNSLEGAGEGYAWNRQDGRRLAEVPRLPGPTRKELNPGSVLSASFDFSGQPAGRVFLIDGKQRFMPHDLRWLERILRHLGPALENLFLLRHLRSLAIEA